MSLSRRISEHRPTVILVVLVTLSLLSLATGTRGMFIRNGVRTLVSVTAYPFLKTLKAIENGGTYVTGLMFSYDRAHKEVQDLQRRLGAMMQRSAQRGELYQENQRLRRMLDFVRNEPRLTLEPVEVIENFKGILMIDHGSLRGLRPSMCAVNEDGVIGLVTQVDPATANVVTLHNPDCRIGAMIARNRVRGIVHGSSSELTSNCTMNYIDMKDDVRVGDRVVTSPESVFPAGYPIGKVVAVHDTKSLWKSADLQPAVDPYRLDEVFVLLRATPSVEELTQTGEEDAAVSVAPEMPDTRPIQERLAP